jgi:hypothetical protein
MCVIYRILISSHVKIMFNAGMSNFLQSAGLTEDFYPVF